MTFDISRIVTGTNPDGKDTIVSVDKIDPAVARAIPGAEFYRIWGTNPGVPQVGAVLEGMVAGPVFPPPGGTRLQIVRWPTDSTEPPTDDPQELYAEAERTLPGALDAISPDAAGNHATDTVDWNVVLDGEMILVMEDGSEAVLGPGACAVVRGSRHAWHNRTDKDAWLLTVFLGAERKS